MKRSIVLTAAALAAAVLVDATGSKPVLADPSVTPEANRRGPVRFEVVFTLDTTGSMGGLIEGAKQKIWWIANQIARESEDPEIRIGLVGYRDVGDAYVTIVHDLSDDLDEVYRRLREFVADGGGDTPEHVSRALHDAVHGISWSRDPRTLRVIFLVGDAPPHTDYQDGFDYRAACRDAIERDIVVNAIQCGQLPETTALWQEIAKLGEGEYAAVDQEGGMRTIPTPMDEELARLSVELDGTILAWGDEETREKSLAGIAEMKALAPPMAAERAAFRASSGAGAAVDLVEAVSSGAIRLDEVEVGDLPEGLRSLTPAERARALEEKKAERAAIEERIALLSRQRDVFLRDRMAGAGSVDSFDANVLELLRRQAAAKAVVTIDSPRTSQE